MRESWKENEELKNAIYFYFFRITGLIFRDLGSQVGNGTDEQFRILQDEFRKLSEARNVFLKFLESELKEEKADGITVRCHNCLHTFKI